MDEKRAMTIARKAFGLTLTSMPKELYLLIDEAVKDERQKPVEPCNWRQPSYDHAEANYWDTDCGESWAITEGKPTENGMKFCHGCGKPIAQHVFKDEEGEE